VSDDEEFLTDLNEAMRDRALDLTKPEDMARYVPVYDMVAKEEDPVQLLANQIRRSRSAKTAMLFSGYRGSGKSTELRRLQNLLRAQDFAVIYLDLDGYLDPYSPVEIGEYLLDIAGAFDDQLAEGAVGTEVPGIPFWTKLGDWLQSWKFQVDEIGGKAGFGAAEINLKASLRENPVFRRQLSQHLTSRLELVVRDIHDFIRQRSDDVMEQFEKAGEPKKGVVLLIDSTEKLADTDETGESVKSSVRSLFTQHAARLKLPNVHAVYSIPPDLKIREPRAINANYEGTVFSLCAITVEKRTANGREPVKAGVDALHQVLVQRHPEVDRLTESEGRLNQLIQASGGNVRSLLALVRSVIDRTFELPVSDRAVSGALKQAADEFRFLTDEERMWLVAVAETGQPAMADEADRALHAEFLDRGVVLPHRNGEEWYDVAPPVRQFLPPDRA
jgi:hypothetical protein